MEESELFSLRFEVLLHLFHLSHGTSERAVPVDALTSAVGRDRDEVWPAAIWLIEIGLAVRANIDAMTITSDGVRQVIQAVLQPEEATRCFPSGVARMAMSNRRRPEEP